MQIGRIIPILPVLLALTTRLPAQEANAPVRALPPNTNARKKAVKPPMTKEAQAVATLSAQLDTTDATARRDALQTLQQIVARASRPGAEAERKTVAAALLVQAPADARHLVATRRTLLELAASVTGEENIPALVSLLADPEMREAAQAALLRTPSKGQEKALVAALTQTRPAEIVPVLIRSLNAPDQETRRLAALFLVESSAPGATTALMQAVENAAPEPRVPLIGVLGKREGKGALMVLVEQAQTRLEPVRIAAYQALDARKDADPEALAGLYDRRLPLAASDAERRVLLAGIARLADPDSLPVLRAELTKGHVQQEILAAMLPVAEKAEQAGKKEEAVAAYRQIVEQSRTPNLRGEAANRLRGLGITSPAAPPH